MKFGRVEVTGSAVLLAAVLYYFDEAGVIPWVLFSCLLHELGHVGAICALGGRVSRVRVSCAGAAIKPGGRRLTPGKTALAALAGPGVNLLLAWGGANLAHFGWGAGLYLFAGLNLGLALFNLLPAGWLDGGVILESLFAALGRERLGHRVVTLFSWLSVLFLTGAALALLPASGGRSLFLLAAGAWTVWGLCRERAQDL